MTPTEARQIVVGELDPNEELLWTDMPSPTRSMRSQVSLCIAGLIWTGFVTAFIYLWHHVSNKDVHGPLGLLGMQGILFNLFFLPVLAIGLAMLFSPWISFRSVQTTLYAITNRRILIIEGLGKARITVKSYGRSFINTLKCTEHRDGRGDVIFNKSCSREADGDTKEMLLGFIGIEDAASVEQLLLNTFQPKDPLIWHPKMPEK